MMNTDCAYAGHSKPNGRRVCRLAIRLVSLDVCEVCDKATYTGKKTGVNSRSKIGTGTEFKKLCEQLGITLPACGACQATLLQMNAVGVAGCREKREEFVSEIKERAKSIGWLDYVHAAANAVTSGLAFSLNPLDPIGSLYDEAVRRVEQIGK